MAKKTLSAEEVEFATRTQYNHGFHDAIFVVRRELDSPERNYGFGPALEINHPEEVEEKHFSKPYGTGWVDGYHVAIVVRYLNRQGMDSDYPQTSTEAWNQAVLEGKVEGAIELY